MLPDPTLDHYHIRSIVSRTYISKMQLLARVHEKQNIMTETLSNALTTLLADVTRLVSSYT
jgi:hypothetical protein